MVNYAETLKIFKSFENDFYFRISNFSIQTLASLLNVDMVQENAHLHLNFALHELFLAFCLDTIDFLYFPILGHYTNANIHYFPVATFGGFFDDDEFPLSAPFWAIVAYPEHCTLELVFDVCGYAEIDDFEGKTVEKILPFLLSRNTGCDILPPFLIFEGDYINEK